MEKDVLTGGFGNPARDAAHAFRTAMDVLARPGSSGVLSQASPPAPMSAAAGTLILTLCDPETPIFLAGAYDCADVRRWIAFHTGAPFGQASDCTFAIGLWTDLLPLARFPIGRADYPDRSATLIVETRGSKMRPHKIAGPGLDGTGTISLPGTEAFTENAEHFPLGLDFFFTDADAVTALPRSTQIVDAHLREELA